MKENEIMWVGISICEEWVGIYRGNLIRTSMNPAKPSKVQVSTQFGSGADYIIRNIMGIILDYIIWIILECGLCRYKVLRFVACCIFGHFKYFLWL